MKKPQPATTTAAGLRPVLFGLWRKHKDEGMLPTNGRFLYYELVSMGLIVKGGSIDGKKGRRSDQNMIEALTFLRKTGDIPWTDIVDETRQLTRWNVHDSIADAIEDAWETATLNFWAPDPPPMILCESRSLAGVLEPLAREYQVPIGSTNGQAAGYLHNEVAPALVPEQVVLYLGDLDLSGGHIENNTHKVLEEIVGPLKWNRIAVTEEQVKTYKLTVIQKYDARDKKTHPAVETEALGQPRIIALLRARLEELMPEARRRKVLERQERERRTIGRKMGFRKGEKS